MIAVAVVGHTARQAQAHRLARQLDARFYLDNGQLGEVENHHRAWAWAAEQPQPWSLVVQDDAIPIPAMLDRLTTGLHHLPSPGLVSLYLGTSYPVQHQRAIQRALHRADRDHAAWIQSTHLLHGVAVAAPTSWAITIADYLALFATIDDQPIEPYDELLSGLAKDHGWPVYYPSHSLVDHADGPTLLDHPDGRGRTKPRHAWRTGAPNWNERVVQLSDQQ